MELTGYRLLRGLVWRAMWNDCRSKIDLAVALKCCAIGLILAHNHPSGNLTASQADIQLTNKLKSSRAIPGYHDTRSFNSVRKWVF